ncbi:GntR family transcriptional regulator [Paracoccus sediminicola]|uniref:GntR family transcriptional regulator n=1 Tax=Paracoccus sediminicola TaxID=3017783 RepID=UPI0022F0FAC4|nr:GntR family transcriptional regulator [Paracoccus sediminicola]WBU56302.1 GntR family transcriptional regulator [Paracoccus sediminicola]
MNEIRASVTEGSKAHRIYLLLKDAIESGRLSPGEKLPGEVRLAEQHGVSRVTVRRAMDALRAAGLVSRRAGRGTTVLEQPLKTTLTASVENLLPNMQKMSDASRVRLLSFAYISAPAQIRDHLRLGSSARVQKSVRVRTIDDEPFCYLTTHVPERFALKYNEADLETSPLFALLERSGVKVSQATQTISAVLADPEVAEALDVTVGSPLIALTRAMFDKSGEGIEHLDALYRPDRFRLHFDLVRTGDAGERSWTSLS